MNLFQIWMEPLSGKIIIFYYVYQLVGHIRIDQSFERITMKAKDDTRIWLDNIFMYAKLYKKIEYLTH